MKHLLSPAHRQHLSDFLAREVLLAFDFDGTLAPIVKRPEEARMRAETRRLLVRVAQRYRVAVISGRAQADVRARLGPVPVWEVVGNHGLEPSHRAGQFEAEVRAWLPPLERALRGVEGVEVEDKRLSIAIHYRSATDKPAARAAIHEAAEALPNVRLVGGKQVLNLLPVGGPTKGHALQRICEKLGCAAALYAGDDQTDEDVFALRTPPLLAIRIGRKQGSAAPFYLHDQGEIDPLLEALAAAREERLPPRATRGPRQLRR